MSLSPHTCHLCLVLHPPSPHNQAVWGYAQRVGHPNGTPPKPSWRAAHSKTLLIDLNVIWLCMLLSNDVTNELECIIAPQLL